MGGSDFVMFLVPMAEYWDLILDRVWTDLNKKYHDEEAVVYGILKSADSGGVSGKDMAEVVEGEFWPNFIFQG